MFEKIWSALCPEYRRTRKDRFRYRWLRPHAIGTVLDIGANQGQFATKIRRILPEARIYSFEPIQECYDKLTARFAADRRFVAFHTALGETEGPAVIHRSAYTPASSLLERSEYAHQTNPKTVQTVAESITIRRLDNVAAELDLTANYMVKLDVQGFEDRVIRGGVKTVGGAKVILMEVSFEKLYEGQLLFDGLNDMLRPMGFTFHGFQGQAIHPQTGVVIFADAIFLKE